MKNFIRETRLKKKITLQQLAEKLGGKTTPMTIQRFETGKRNVRRCVRSDTQRIDHGCW